MQFDLNGIYFVPMVSLKQKHHITDCNSLKVEQAKAKKNIFKQSREAHAVCSWAQEGKDMEQSKAVGTGAQLSDHAAKKKGIFPGYFSATELHDC